MKFLHVADIHIGYRQYNSQQRFEDFGNAFAKVVDFTINETVDVCVIAGDLFHKSNIDPDTLLQAEKSLSRLANANVISTGVLKQILSEGRKFGVGVGLISQRPGKLDSDVLSQCNTQFLLRIVNPVDQARVAESVESVGRDLLKELPALNKGQAIISGVAVNTPVICQIRERFTKHGGEGSKASEAWQQYFSETSQQDRDCGSSLPRPRKRR